MCQFKLCLGIHGAINIYLIYYNNLYTIRSGIQTPLIWYIVVTDRFTTDIRYIQVTLPPYLKLCNVVNKIFRVPLFKI